MVANGSDTPKSKAEHSQRNGVSRREGMWKVLSVYLTLIDINNFLPCLSKGRIPIQFPLSHFNLIKDMILSKPKQLSKCM